MTKQPLFSICLFMILLHSLAAKTPIVFSEEEIRYIEQSSEIIIGGGISFEPFMIDNGDGSAGGFDADILELISQRTGLNFTIKLDVWDDIQKAARLAEVDGLSSVLYPLTEDRQQYLNSSYTYLTLSPVVVIKKGNPHNFYTLDDLQGKTIALQKGNQLFKKLYDELQIDADIIYFDKLNDCLSAIVSGSADFTFLDETALYLASIIGLGGLIDIAFPVGEPFSLCFGLRKDDPLLISIFNKGLADISKEKIYELRRKWFFDFDSDYSNPADSILTAKERDYIKLNEAVYFEVKSENLPYWNEKEGVSEQGIIADYMDLLRANSGLNLQSLKFAEEKSPPAFIIEFVLNDSKIRNNPEKDKNSPLKLFSFPITISTDYDKLFLEDISLLQNDTVAVIKGSLIHDVLVKRGYTILPVESLTDGFKAVRQKAVYGYIDCSVAVVWALQKENRNDIKISGVFDNLTIDLLLNPTSMNDLQTSIIIKTANSIMAEEKQQILNKWISISIIKQNNYRLAWIISGIALFIITASLLWNRWILKTKKEKQVALDELSKVRKKLEENNRELEILAVRDQLTGLYNRNKLASAIILELSRIERYGGNFGLFIIDIDHFKAVNDKYGHNGGDLILQELSSLLSGKIREPDLLGRWGGEEFIVLAVNTPGIEMNQFGERLLNSVRVNEFSHVGKLSVSIGATQWLEGDDSKTIVSRADNALYRAKENGRDRFVASQ